jgi:hypothetical protein
MRLAFTSDRKALAVFFDRYFLKGFKVLFDIGPFKYVASSIQTTFKLFSQNQSQETAEYVAPYENIRVASSFLT